MENNNLTRAEFMLGSKIYKTKISCRLFLTAPEYSLPLFFHLISFYLPSFYKSED